MHQIRCRRWKGAEIPLGRLHHESHRDDRKCMGTRAWLEREQWNIRWSVSSKYYCIRWEGDTRNVREFTGPSFVCRCWWYFHQHISRQGWICQSRAVAFRRDGRQYPSQISEAQWAHGKPVLCVASHGARGLRIWQDVWGSAYPRQTGASRRGRRWLCGCYRGTAYCQPRSD